MGLVNLDTLDSSSVVAGLRVFVFSTVVFDMGILAPELDQATVELTLATTAEEWARAAAIEGVLLKWVPPAEIPFDPSQTSSADFLGFDDRGDPTYLMSMVFDVEARRDPLPIPSTPEDPVNTEPEPLRAGVLSTVLGIVLAIGFVIALATIATPIIVDSLIQLEIPEGTPLAEGIAVAKGTLFVIGLAIVAVLLVSLTKRRAPLAAVA